MSAIKNGDRVTGRCLCHHTPVTGTAGTVAAPGPLRDYDLLSGKAVRVWHVVADEDADRPRAQPHTLAARGLVRA